MVTAHHHYRISFAPKHKSIEVCRHKVTSEFRTHCILSYFGGYATERRDCYPLFLEKTFNRLKLQLLKCFTKVTRKNKQILVRIVKSAELPSR